MTEAPIREQKDELDELPEVPVGFPWPVVLGVDPGTRLIGYGALVLAPGEMRLLAAGTLNTGPGEIATRLASLQAGMHRLLRRLRPSVVVVEQAFTAVNVQSALRIGEGRGVVLACSAAAGSEIVQLTPARTKKALVGNGRAAKHQVARMVALELGLEELPGLDATDALALALAHSHGLRRGSALP